MVFLIILHVFNSFTTQLPEKSAITTGTIISTESYLTQRVGLSNPIPYTQIQILHNNRIISVNIPGGTLDGVGVKVSGFSIPHIGDKYSLEVSLNGVVGSETVNETVTRNYKSDDGGVPVYEKNSQGVILWWSSKGIFITPDSFFSPYLNEMVEESVLRWINSINGESSLELIIDQPGSVEAGFDRDGSNYNIVTLVTDVWEWGVADAITIITYIDDPDDPDDGRFLDGDIIVNGTNGRFSGDTETNSLLLRIIIHELGHLIGLDHPCNIPTEFIDESLLSCSDPTLLQSIGESVMYPFSSTDNNYPNDLDVEGVSYLFPMGDSRSVNRVDLSDDGCSCSAGNSGKFPAKWFFFWLTILLVLRFYLINKRKFTH